MASFDEWLGSLSYSSFEKDLVRSGDGVGARPYGLEIEEMLSVDRGIGAGAVFCVDHQPTVCFIDASTLGADPEARISGIRQKVWNQNLVSVIIVLDTEKLS